MSVAQRHGGGGAVAKICAGASQPKSAQQSATTPLHAPHTAACGFTLIAAKYYLDNFGPLSPRGKRQLGASSSTAQMLAHDGASDDPVEWRRRQQQQQRHQRENGHAAAAEGGLGSNGAAPALRSSLELRPAAAAAATQLPA